jgi:hypothetical protein
MRAASVGTGLAALILCIGSPATAMGQDLAPRDLETLIENAGAREVSFRFETHDEVRRCGDGWSRHSGGDWDQSNCWSGPAEVTLELRDGRVADLDVEIVRASAPAPDGFRDRGDVRPQDAADYLLTLVDVARPSVAEDAIGAAAMADGVELWPQLLTFARDRSLDSEVRQSATFWVGQASADEAVIGLRGLVRDDPDTEVRESAVFALSQRDAAEAVPILIEIAEDVDSPEVRRSAFFWLAQHDDPRVLDFFERVLKGSG